MPEVFAAVEERVAARVAEIKAERDRGEEVWPVIEYADIASGSVSAEILLVYWFRVSYC